MAGCQLFFKAENLQRVGAFKFRGACNAVFSLGDDEARAGVLTHSSGNHAAALALAARLRGIPAHIVMPRSAPAIKKAAVAGYGARIVECEPTLEARESTAERVRADTGAHFVHPYNDPQVIAGQGTAALELLEEIADLDAVIAPIGGGGLLSGTAISVVALQPASRVYGAEPAGADDARRSLLQGEIVPSVNPQTLCDGLLTSLGTLTFALLRQHRVEILLADDRDTVVAMRTVWERMKILVELSSAVAVAVALSGALAGRGCQRVGVILSGGNVDLEQLPWQLAAGASMET